MLFVLYVIHGITNFYDVMNIISLFYTNSIFNVSIIIISLSHQGKVGETLSIALTRKGQIKLFELQGWG